MSKREKILETVKKLIVHADSPACTREEQLAFSTKVAELMREYRIERHEVEPSVIDAMDFREYGTTMVDAYPAGADGIGWQALVFHVIAEAHACQVILLAGTNAFFVAGHIVDRAVAGAVSAAIVNSITRLAAEAWDEAEYGDPAVLLGYINRAQYEESYRSGFLQALRERLTESEEACDETALIHIGRAVTRTQKYLQTVINGQAGSVTAEMEIQHGGAAARGYDDGMRADLESQRLTGGNHTGTKEIAS